MLFDKKVLFCHDTAIAGTGQVGDILDLNDPDLNLDVGEQAFVGVMITEDLVHTADLGVVFTLETDSEDGFGTDNFDLFVSRAYLKAEVLNGVSMKFPIPDGCLQFIRIKTVVNTPTAGKMTSGFVG